MILRINQPGAIGHALLALRAGQVIALPTDTVYGLACDSLNEAAIERLYELKQRPPIRPIPLLLGELAQMESVAQHIPPAAERLAARFWPGALTMVVPALPVLSPILTAGTGNVGLRVPNHRFVRYLARALGRPLAATSANLSGQPSAADAGQVQESFGEALPLIMDGGPSAEPVASSVVDLTREPPILLRAGPIPMAAILDALATG